MRSAAITDASFLNMFSFRYLVLLLNSPIPNSTQAVEGAGTAENDPNAGMSPSYPPNGELVANDADRGASAYICCLAEAIVSFIPRFSFPCGSC